MRNVDKKFGTDWKKIGPVLAQEAAKIIRNVRPVQFQGLNFYASYGPGDYELEKWFRNTVKAKPGVSIHVASIEKKKSYPKCPECYRLVRFCPKCKADMRGTEEKGVDVRMATDMIKLA